MNVGIYFVTYNPMNDFKNSALEELQESDDIALGSSQIQKPNNPIPLIEYNQKLIDEWACVFVAGMATAGGVINREWTTQELLEVKALAPKYGRQPNVGMTISKGADLVIDYLKTKGHTISKQTIYLKDSARTYLDAGREIHTGGKVNSKYYNDMQEDGDLDLTSFGAMEYGHSFRLKKIDGKYYVIDNYKGHLKYNVVEIKDLDGLIRGGNFFNSGIIYIPNKQTTMYTRPAHIPYIKPEEAKTEGQKNTIIAWLTEVPNEMLGSQNGGRNVYDETWKMGTDLFKVRNGIKKI